MKRALSPERSFHDEGFDELEDLLECIRDDQLGAEDMREIVNGAASAEEQARLLGLLVVRANDGPSKARATPETNAGVRASPRDGTSSGLAETHTAHAGNVDKITVNGFPKRKDFEGSMSPPMFSDLKDVFKGFRIDIVCGCATARSKCSSSATPMT